MIVRRALKNSTVVPGGGAIDVCLHEPTCLIGMLYFVKADLSTVLVDGDKSVSEAACEDHCWEVPTVYKFVRQSPRGKHAELFVSKITMFYPLIL